MTATNAQRLRTFVVRSVVLRIVMTIALAALGLWIIVNHGDAAITMVVEKEGSLRRMQQQTPAWSAAAAFLLYVVACFVPGTNGKALIVGWLLGVFIGTIVINLASTVAAFAMFTIARRCFHDFFRDRYASRLVSMDERVRESGGQYLFAIRMVPIVPFFIVNTLMGVSAMSCSTFWWATQLGMLPSNIAFAWLGASLPSIRDVQQRGFSELLSWQVLLSAAILCVLPIVTRRVLIRFTRRS